MKRSKRILSAILVVLLLASTLNGFVFAAGETEPTTVSDYNGLVQALTNGSKNIVLNNDIVANADTTFSFDGENKTIIVKKGANTVTLDAKTFSPVGDSPDIDSLGLNKLTTLKDLSGVTFDGQGFKIVGLYTTNPAMFGSVQKNSVIKNLKFENVLVMNSTAQNVAVLAQVLYGDVSDITVEGAVVIGNEGTIDYAHVGGIVGRSVATALSGNVGQEKYPQIKNSTFDGYVIASNASKNTCAGGIAGQVQGGELLNCINYGDVAVINGTRYGLGGIAGLVEAFDGANGDTVKLGKRGDNHVLNCANLGNVTDYTTNRNSEEHIGGIIGYLDLIWNANGEAHLRNLYNAGNVMRNNGTSIAKAGNGIIGKLQNPSTGTGNSGKLTDADGNAQTYRARFTSENKGIAEYHYCDESAVVSSPVYSFSADIYSTQRISTSAVYAGLAEYYMNCNAGNIEGACAWKRENGKAVPDIGTPAKDPATPDVTKTGEIDAAEFDYVKYYNSNDASLTDVLEGMFNEHKDESGGTTSFLDSTNTWRYDKGGHLHKMSGTNYNTAFTSVGADGTYFEVTFTGTGIEWHTKYRNVMSSVDVYVDGELVETLSAESLSTANKDIHDTNDFLVYGIYGLEDGVHTLRGVDTSSGMMVVDFFKLIGTGAAGVQTEAREFDGYIKLDDNKHLHLFKGSTVEGFVSSHAVSYKGSCACELVDAADYDYVKYFDKDGKPVASANLEMVKADGLAHKTAENYPASGDANSTNAALAYANHYAYYGNNRYYKTNAFLTSDAGASFTVVFNGTGIEWHTDFRAPGDKMADIEIYIDDELKGSKTGIQINDSLSTDTNKYLTDDYKLFEITDLEDCTHVFVAKSTTKGTIIADYFKIIDGSAVKTTVAPEAVKEPLIYNAAEQTGVVGVNTCVGDDVHYTLSDETHIDADEYTATATLKDGYLWSDGTSDPVEVGFAIAKKPVTVTANDKNVEYGGDLPEEYDATVEGLIDGDELEYQVTCDDADSGTIDTYAIIADGDEEQGNYLVTYVPGTLTVGHEHTQGEEWMYNSEAHWHACGTTCPIGTTVEEYEEAFVETPGLKETLGYAEHQFVDGYCEECNFYALPDYGTELEVKNITYSDNTISVAFNVPYDSVDMHDAAKLAVYATSEDIDELVELKQPQNEIDYELTYDEDNNAVVTFAYDYKFVSIGIKNSEIALNPMEFFMLDDGVSEEEGDEDDDEELKLKKWIACNTNGAPKSEFDFVFFTTREEVYIATDSKLLTTDTYDAYSYGEGDYQISLFNNAMLIDSQLLTSKYLRVATLANNEYEVKLQLVAQDVGGLLGYQESLSNSNYHRILAPITMDETDAIVNYVTVRGWYGENFEYELDYEIDCVYTAYYDHSTLVDVATTLNVNGESAFAVIVIDGEGETHTGFDGPIYVRIYSDATDEYGDPILLRDGVLILG